MATLGNTEIGTRLGSLYGLELFGTGDTYTPTSNGTLTSMMGYLDYSKPDVGVQFGLYDSDDNFVGYTEKFTSSETFEGWVELEMTAPVAILAAKSYRLCILGDGYIYQGFRQSVGASSGYRYCTGIPINNWPDPIIWRIDTPREYNLSGYGIYTPTGVTPTISSFPKLMLGAEII